MPRKPATASSLLSGLAIVLLCQATMPLRAQTSSPRFGRVAVEDGLPHGAVTSITQDPQGFLWFGTQDGLCRFDGYGCRVFRHDPEDATSLPRSEVWDLLTDQAGTLWIATGSGDLARFDRQRESFQTVRLKAGDAGSAQVFKIAEDKTSGLWLGTADGLLHYAPETGGVTEFPVDPNDPGALNDPRIGALYKDSAGTLWVGTYAGLHRLDRRTGRFTRYLEDPADPFSLGNHLINDLREDGSGTLWVATAHGLYRFEPASERFHPYRTAALDLSTRRIFQLHLDRAEDFWVGTANDGLYRFEHGSGRVHHASAADGDPQGLVGNRIRHIFEDRAGTLWFATFVGVSSFDRRQQQFTTWRRRGGEATTLSGNSISGLAEDRQGRLWVGTWDRGLNRLDRAAEQVVQYHADPEDPHSLPDETVTAVLETRDGTLWVGTWGGLARWRSASDDFAVWQHDPLAPLSLANDAINGLYEDRRGMMWVGTVDGVDRFDPTTMEFEHLALAEGLESVDADAFLEDHSGVLWLAGRRGLLQYDAARDVLRPRPFDHGGKRGCDAGIEGLYEDPHHGLWLATQSGLGWLDASRAQLRCWQETEGLAADSVLALLPGGDGELWLTTNQGLTRFDPQTETFTNFGVDDGLQSNSFSVRSAFRSSRGELFFGGIRGFNTFFPGDIELDPRPPPIILTEFLVHNQPVRPGDANNPYLEVSISEAETLVLSHRDRMISFELAALHYAAPELNRYAWRLEGFDEEWVETTAEKRFATYTSLPAGEYNFRVRASNKDEVWNEAETALHIKVRPPPWKSWWAYTLYALALVAGAGHYVRSQKKKLVAQAAIAEHERQVSDKLREVDRLKDEFLAKTSHELRTPLYGITGLAESLLGTKLDQLPDHARRDLTLIISSGRRLSTLVDDLLDVSRLAGKNLELRRRPVDLAALAEVVLAISRPLLGGKKVELVHAVPRDLPAADGDENRLEQILQNLVGNAIKFTEAGVVEVSAREEDRRLRVAVRDTGIGISEKQHEKIFQAFEQADASIEREYGGTGLGLAVSRQLVELHGGRLWLNSTPGEGSTFFFTLPVATDLPAETSKVDEAWQDVPALILEKVSPAPKPATPDDTARQRGKRILIVDDEPVVRQVLQNHLDAAGYAVEQVGDGHEALRLLEGEEPPYDLILLDVMMPRLSGYEVCHRIRLRRGPHKLPVLFLTAKGQPEDRLAGLEAGANDYLTKPIDRAELLARVALHLELLAMHRYLEESVARRTAQVKVLSGLLPICAQCSKVRDDYGYWEQIETYISDHSEAEFSHGLCPECTEELYPGVAVRNS